MKEKYEHLKFQALKKTNAILFLASHLNRGIDVLVFSRTLYFSFHFFNHIILLIIKWHISLFDLEE